MSDAITQKFITDNLGLVRMCALKFKDRGIEYEELYSSGCLGLVKAAKNFNPDLGYAFSTYAVPVILGEIKRCFRDGGNLKVSRSMKEKAREIHRLQEDLEIELGHSVDIETLADKFGITVFEAAELINVYSPVISLDSNDDEYARQVPEESFEEQSVDRLTVTSLLSRLSPEESELIRLRYFKGLTQAETGIKMGISQVQVSRKEKYLLKLMRKLYVA